MTPKLILLLLALSFGGTPAAYRQTMTVTVVRSGKINHLEDMTKTVTADVYIGAHTHMPASFRLNHVVCNPQNMTTSQKEQLFVNTASFLDWSGSYGDKLGLSPNSKIMPVITLSHTEHRAQCTV